MMYRGLKQHPYARRLTAERMGETAGADLKFDLFAGDIIGGWLFVSLLKTGRIRASGGPDG